MFYCGGPTIGPRSQWMGPVHNEWAPFTMNGPKLNYHNTLPEWMGPHGDTVPHASDLFGITTSLYILGKFRGGARNFPTGADSSAEGAKIWFLGYYKCQKSPKKIVFHLPTTTPLALPWRHPLGKLTCKGQMLADVTTRSKALDIGNTPWSSKRAKQQNCLVLVLCLPWAQMKNLMIR